MTKSQPSYTDAARRYAQSVAAGDILDCRWVQRACQRQLDDPARCKGKASPYRFNPKLTDKQGRTVWTIIQRTPWQVAMVQLLGAGARR